MSWFQMMATAGDNQTITYQSAAATTCEDQYIMTWVGLAESSFDGYDRAYDQPETVQQFTADSSDWPNRIQWGGKHKSWIRVTANPQFSTATTDGNPPRVFNFYYRWTGNYPTGQHIDNLTINFAPIPEDQEVAPETFLKWLEKIGHDDAFLRVSYKMQKKMMKLVGHKPPWDPRRIKELEEQRLNFMDRVRELNNTTEKQKTWEEKLYERWGIREIPSITPELLDQIVERSTAFLKECLSEEELKWYDEEGHIKVRSRQSNIFYIIEKKAHGNIERWVNNKHVENICYQSNMSKLPLNDTLAMKVLDVKHNEEEFLRIGNRRRIVVRH